MKDRQQLFDNWANDYDSAVSGSEGAFPFDGYDRVLDEVVKQAQVTSAASALDLGTGTGNLAARLVVLGCTLWGTDFSPKMLEKAQARLPEAIFIQADISKPWPPVLQRRFDRVVSAYLFHEFNLEAKVHLVEKIANHHLKPGGRIVIADIAFETLQSRAQARQGWQDLWDEDEFYWAADESLAALHAAGLAARYTQVSSCGGVFTIDP